VTVACVPWLYNYLGFIPRASAHQNRAYGLAAQYVNRRLKEGSNIKDLYYHLMSEIVSLPVISC
jgi:hypothetical protein